MYYATYKKIGDSDIAVFKTEQERDDWVNFKDQYSKALNVNAENCTFERMSISSETAERRMKQMLHKKDDFNPEQAWYILC